MPGIAQSRWVFFVHCVRSVGKILSQMSGRLERLLPKQAKAFLSPWTGCDRKDRDVVKGKKKKEERQAEVSKRSESEWFFEVHFP